jgi:hypothetical protein
MIVLYCTVEWILIMSFVLFYADCSGSVCYEQAECACYAM